MSAGAWIMLIIGCLLLYGGLAVCLFIASGARKYSEEDFDEGDYEELENFNP